MQLTVEGINAVTREFQLGIPDIKEITDNDWFLEVLRMSSGITVQGGSAAQEKIKLPKGRSGGYYANDDVLNYKSSSPYSYATYNWSHQYEDATVFKTDILKCSGPEAIVNLIDDASKDAYQRMILCSNELGVEEGIAVDIFNAYDTATAASRKMFVGINRMLTTNRELGGITSGTGSCRVDMWNPHSVDMDADGTPIPLTLARLSKELKYTEFGPNKPTLGLYTPGLNEKLENLFQYYARYRMEELKSLRGGLENILIRGIPLTEERRLMTETAETAQGGQITFLDMNSLRMVLHSDDNFQAGEWKELTNQKGFVKTIDLTFTMTYRRPRTNMKMFAISPTAI